MTDSACRSRKRGLFQRLRNSISRPARLHSTQLKTSGYSVSPEAPSPTSSKQEPSVLSSTPSPLRRRRAKSDLTAQPSSHTGKTTSTAHGPAATSDILGEILEKALKLLEEPERVTIEGYIGSDDIASALEYAFEAAQAKRKVCEGKRWIVTVGRHTLKLQDEADKVMLWLDRFKQVGDIAVNADPIHAGLPWAGIRLLLQAAVSETYQMRALLTGLKTALYTMNRLKAYLEYLSTLPETQSRANFESVLIELHAHILQFLAKAIRIYQRRTLSRAIDAFWKPEDITGFERECDRIGARAEIEASNCDRTLSAVDREEAKHRTEHLRKALKELGELRGIEGTLNTLASKIDLAGLPTASGAAFNSYKDELDARCHPDTRIELLHQIKDWADDGQGKCIFWLNGMAGTGKSTISRTVAQTFADAGRLGASFFFKRGEGERGNASRFFTTVPTQLARTVPAIIPYLIKAVDTDPNISERLMKEQFERLIFQPLSEVGRGSTSMIELVIVIDALDECERDGDIKNILHLLSRIQHLDSTHVRIFLTSRPELPIRLGFKKMSAGAHQDVILQDITKNTIKDDISSFLKAEFQKIRDDYNNLRPEESSLPEGWPGEHNIEALSKMAVPLFIFAATVSRFVGDLRWDPKQRLADVLKYQLNSQVSKLDKTYLPVLDYLSAGLGEAEKDDLVREFRAIVGSIIILVEPLGTCPLARLLNVDKGTIDCRLDSLHSVLSIPPRPDAPIRLLHLSFREFLLDPYKRGKNPFWVDETERHEAIATSCLEQMSGCLHENISHLEFPGKPREEIDRVTVEKCLPVEVRYACRHWVYHVIESRRPLKDHDAVHSFLQKQFLHWLEALSLMGRLSDSIEMIGALQSVATMSRESELSHFLSDARRFILLNRSIIHKAPLQLYSSAIIFTPKESIVRKTFEKPISWISGLPKVPRAWNLELQKLEGHKYSVEAVKISADGQLLASASNDRTVRVWNPITGEQLQQFEGHNDPVIAVAFSPDSQLLASAGQDKTVRLWNPATGEQVQLFGGHGGKVNSIAFSADGQLLASASDDWTVIVWNPATGEQLRQFKGHSNNVKSVAFSADGQLLASASDDWTVIVWNPATGEQLRQFKGYSMSVLNAVAFSPNGQLLASASNDTTIRLWHLDAVEKVQQFAGHSELVNAVAFSPDGQLLASASDDNTIRLWNPTTGEQVQRFAGHNGWVKDVAFSADGQLLASASTDKTVRLWKPTTSEQVQELEGHSGRVNTFAFSADGQLLASASDDCTIRLWRPPTGEQVQELEGHSERVNTVVFSADGQLLASASNDKTIRLWNTATGEQLQKLEGHIRAIKAVTFAADGQLLASASNDQTVRLWNLATGEHVLQFEGHSSYVTAVAFSADSKLLASASNDKTVRLWDPTTGEQLQQLKGHSNSVNAVAFSADSHLLASASDDKTVRIWDPTTGEQVQQLQDYNVIFHQLYFSADSQCLKTDRGTIYLHSDQFRPRPIMPQKSNNLFVDGDWITCDEKNLLWLPTDYRGTCFAWRGNVLAIGQDSGQVHFFEFNI